MCVCAHVCTCVHNKERDMQIISCPYYIIRLNKCPEASAIYSRQITHSLINQLPLSAMACPPFVTICSPVGVEEEEEGECTFRVRIQRTPSITGERTWCQN